MNPRQAKALGRAIRTLREDRRLSRNFCAGEARISEPSWRAIEAGRATVDKNQIAVLAGIVEAEESDVYERVFDLL